MATAAVTPAPAAGRNKRSRVGAVAGGVYAVYGRRLGCVDGDGAVIAQLAAKRARDFRAQLPADVEEQRVALERLPVVEADAAEAPGFIGVQRDDGRLRDRDAEGLHARKLVAREVVRPVAER
jgi:hypothetical protein